MHKQLFSTLMIALLGAASTTYAASPLPAAATDVGGKVSLYGVNLSGGEFGDIGRAYGSGYIYPDLSTLQYFAGKGMRFGRLPFKWERVQPTLSGALDAAEVARLHAFLKDAATAGVGILLDMHNYAQYQLPNGNKPHIGEDATLTTATYADAWKRLAAEFKNDAALIGYDIMNEPQGFSNPQGRTWFSAAQAAVNAIRTVDTGTTIYIEGDCWASAANWSTCNNGLAIKDPSNNFVYSAHQYFDASASGNYDNTTYDNQGVTPSTGVNRVSGFVAWLKSNNARGHIGEYGVPNNDPRYLVTLQNMMDYLALNCVSGTYWAAGPWWGDYLLSVQPNGQDRPQMAVLVKYGVSTCQQSTYTPPAPIAAPTAPPTPVATGQSVSAKDVTKIDITKPTAVSQMQSESNNTAFDWGYVNAGATIDFALNVASAGTYQLILNQASVVNTTGMDVLVNNVKLTTVRFNQTNEYSNYSDTTPVTITLPAGNVTLRLVAIAAGFNFAGARLTPVTVSSTPAAPSINIGQPVNASGTTTIDITKPTKVSLMKAEANNIAFDWGGINPSAYIEFTVNVTSAGNYGLVLKHASWAAKTGFSVVVNGTSVASVVLNPTGNSWTYAVTPPTTIALPAGVVTLRLVAAPAASLNLAGVSLTR